MATAHPAKFVEAIKMALPKHQMEEPAQLKSTKEKKRFSLFFLTTSI